MKVSALERLDSTTIRCRVSWDATDTREAVSVVVSVPATLSEVGSPIDRNELPETVKSLAIKRASDVTLVFANWVSRANVPTGHTPAFA